MITRQKAEDAAQAIVAAAKAEADELREKKARGAPIGLRIPGLHALPKRVQDTLVREAFEAAKHSFPSQVASAVWALVCLAGWLVAKPYFGGAGPLAVLLAAAGVFAIWTAATRNELRRLLAAFKSSRPSRAA